MLCDILAFMLRCTISLRGVRDDLDEGRYGMLRRPNEHEHKTSGTLAAWLPVLAAVGIMATGCLSTFLVLQLDEFRPKVGDMVVFRPGSQDADMWQMQHVFHDRCVRILEAFVSASQIRMRINMKYTK